MTAVSVLVWKLISLRLNTCYIIIKEGCAHTHTVPITINQYSVM